MLHVACEEQREGLWLPSGERIDKQGVKRLRCMRCLISGPVSFISRLSPLLCVYIYSFVFLAIVSLHPSSLSCICPSVCLHMSVCLSVYLTVCLSVLFLYDADTDRFLSP